MNNLISLSPYHIVEIAGLTSSVCKQLNIPSDGIKELGDMGKLRDKINIISSKTNLKIYANNELAECGKAINKIALELISQGVLDEKVLKNDLKDFLSKLPPLVP